MAACAAGCTQRRWGRRLVLKAGLGISPRQRATTCCGVATHLRAEQRTKGNGPGAAVIAGHGISHRSPAEATDQPAGVAALGLLLRGEWLLAVGLIATAPWYSIARAIAVSGISPPPGARRCSRSGIVLNAARPTGLGDGPGARHGHLGKQSADGCRDAKAADNSSTQPAALKRKQGHDGSGVCEEAREQPCSLTCHQPNRTCQKKGD